MKQLKSSLSIEITTWTILKTIVLLVVLFVLWQLRAVAFMLFFAFILYSAFDPVIDYLEKRKVPRWLSIILIYLIGFALFTFILVVSANVLIDQVGNLSNDSDRIIRSFIDALTKVFPWLENRVDPSKIASDITGNGFSNKLFSSNTVSNAFGVLNSVGSIILGIFVVVVLSIYMLNRQEKFYSPLVEYLPKSDRKVVLELMRRIEDGLGAWFVGELSLMFIIGLLTWIGIMLPSLFFPSYTLDQYALSLALIAGLLEAVPNIGPTITVLIAMIVAVGSGNLTTGDTTLIIVAQSGYVAALGTLIQNLEAVFIVPFVMKKAVGVDPIVTIIGVIAALSIFGIVGALLIIPIIATAQIAFNFYQEQNR